MSEEYHPRQDKIVKKVHNKKSGKTYVYEMNVTKSYVQKGKKSPLAKVSER